MKRDLALFDFDGTLTTSDTLRGFFDRCVGANVVRRAAARHPLDMARALLGGEHRDRAKATMTRALLAGREHEQLVGLAREHAKWIQKYALRDDTIAWFRWHQTHGHRVMIISASFDAYVQAVGEHLGADSVIATRWEIGRDGCLTGNLEGANVRGPEKVRRILASLEYPESFVYGYGDSEGDAELLAFADLATWVRSTRLPSPPRSNRSTRSLLQ